MTICAENALMQISVFMNESTTEEYSIVRIKQKATSSKKEQVQANQQLRNPR